MYLQAGAFHRIYPQKENYYSIPLAHPPLLHLVWNQWTKCHIYSDILEYLYICYSLSNKEFWFCVRKLLILPVLHFHQSPIAWHNFVWWHFYIPENVSCEEWSFFLHNNFFQRTVSELISSQWTPSAQVPSYILCKEQPHIWSP